MGQSLTYNGVTVNLDWAFTQTKAQFQAHEAHHGFTQKQMDEWWSLIVALKPKAKKPVE